MSEANKQKSLIDISVLLVFFTRHETFAKVFDVVKQVRPARLFLYQDGPREARPDDIENIAKCREIAADIDWDCEVKTLYQEKNVGCDPSGYIAHTWAFSQTDKCIVLEDDVVPTLSFFYFCKAMLDKYEDDDRIMLISGFNPEEQTPVKSDYFFSATTFTWGWASWARVVNDWDEEYSFLDDEEKCRQIQDYIRRKHLVKNMLNVFRAHRATGKPHFETILIANQYCHKGLTIVPQKNMVNNIGVTGDSTHFANDLALIPKVLRRIFTMGRYETVGFTNGMSITEYEGLLKPPNEISDYEAYRKSTYRIYGWGHPVVKIWRLVESTFYKLVRGDLKGIFADVKDKFGKLISHRAS
jgi:hypothetical protein